MSDLEQKILVVDAQKKSRESTVACLTGGGFCCVDAADSKQASVLLAGGGFAVAVVDSEIDGGGVELIKQCRADRFDVAVIVTSEHPSVELAVESIKLGAAEFLTRPYANETLLAAVGNHIAVGEVAVQSFVATSQMMVGLLEMAQRAAQTDATILVTGESGTGKEVLSQFIHTNSPRRDAAFVAINCAAIPENMLEAILFGYEKGAFTGALQSTPGKFEQAQGGTLLLDEVSEMSLELQAKLLRVLQEKQVERLGGSKVIDLDIRVIATSNRDLTKAVREGLFREDLYYRLSVFPVRLPPLSDRTDDILPLVERALKRFSDKQRISNPGISATAREALRRYPWPGNVRELENVIERALIISNGKQIDVEHLVFDVISATAPAPTASPTLKSVNAMPSESLKNQLRDREHLMVVEALSNSGNRQEAADLLGISQRTLRYKLAQLRKAGVALPT